jgi:TolB protein
MILKIFIFLLCHFSLFVWGQTVPIIGPEMNPAANSLGASQLTSMPLAPANLMDANKSPVAPVAGSPEQSSSVVVPVGQASDEKVELSFNPILNSYAGSPSSLELRNKLHEIITNDLGFYPHLMTLTEMTKMDDAKNSQKFLIDLNVLKSDKDQRQVQLLIQPPVTGKGSKLAKEKLNKTFTFIGTDLRSDAHHISSQIYLYLFDRPSVFQSKIVFISDKDSYAKERIKELYLMDFDGANLQKLTNLKSIVISPEFNFDNTKILFSAYAEKTYMKYNRKHIVKNLNLYELDIKTKKIDLISEREGLNTGAIYDTNHDFIYLTLTDNNNADIFRMNKKSKAITHITKDAMDDVDPSIDATGERMCFLSSRKGAAHIHTLDPSGVEKSVQRVGYIGKFNSFPRFSPDGKSIIFSSWLDNGFDVFLLESQGKNVSRLTKNFGSNEEANFSMDGELILFTSMKNISKGQTIQDMYIMTKEGEVVKRLSNNLGKIFSPRFSK